MLQCLHHAHVRVLQGSVLSYQHDGNSVEKALGSYAHLSPAHHELVTLELKIRTDNDATHVETLLKERDEALFPEKQGNVVGGLDVVHTKNLLGRYVTEHGHLLHSGSEERIFAPASNLPVSSRTSQVTHEIRYETEASKVADACLRRLRLLFTANDWDEGDVNERKVFVANAELELTHSLNEGRRLNVTNGSTKLDM